MARSQNISYQQVINNNSLATAEVHYNLQDEQQTNQEQPKPTKTNNQDTGPIHIPYIGTQAESADQCGKPDILYSIVCRQSDEFRVKFPKGGNKNENSLRRNESETS